VDGNLAEPSKVPFGEDRGCGRLLQAKDRPAGRKGITMTISSCFDGAAVFREVLFPRLSPGPEHDAATGICALLWNARQAVACSAGAPSRRQAQVPAGAVVDVTVHVAVDAGALGTVGARVCPYCWWAAWDAEVEHPVRCYTGEERQVPDIHPDMGAMGVDLGLPGSVDAPGSGWQEYHAALFTPAVVRAFIKWKRHSSGAGIARRLWAQREQVRRAHPSTDASSAADAATAGAHTAVVLDAVPQVAYAACLACTWLDPDGVPMRGENWRAQAAQLAREHGSSENLGPQPTA
jgi:hypothetical protein